MKYYFGQVSAEDAYDSEVFASPDDNDNFYYYGVEFGSNPGGTDEVLIFDSVGRHLPIDTDNIPALIQILEGFVATKKLLDSVEAIEEIVIDPAHEVSL